eukprot:scaffold145_cov84-Isochrysis_galbana.AAC.1
MDEWTREGERSGARPAHPLEHPPAHAPPPPSMPPPAPIRSGPPAFVPFTQDMAACMQQQPPP